MQRRVILTFFFFALLSLGLLSSVERAQAARFTGAYLLKICGMDQAGRELVPGGHTACQAYISGVLDYHSVLQSMKIAPRVDICLPKDAGIDQLHRIVLDFLQKNVEHDGFIAAPAVTMALYNRYPCK